jgi:type IV secretory pathway protease TraF
MPCLTGTRTRNYPGGEVPLRGGAGPDKCDHRGLEAPQCIAAYGLFGPNSSHGSPSPLLVRRVRGDQAQLRVGDIVVFSAPEREWLHPIPGAHHLVKRVAALGDAYGCGVAGPVTEATITEHLPSDSVVVLGDNPSASQDSRHFGPVGRRSIIGVMRPGTDLPPRRPTGARRPRGPTPGEFQPPRRNSATSIAAGRRSV